ncbi:hypothetical protein D3C77_427750 [compost metagenome]
MSIFINRICAANVIRPGQLTKNMGWRRYAQLRCTVASKSLELIEYANEMMVFSAQFTCNAQTDIFSCLIFRTSIKVAEKITMIRNITIYSLKAPNKI